MKEPLQKIDQQHVYAIADSGHYVSEMVEVLWNTLNATIDRINELEAKYEGHEHRVSVEDSSGDSLGGGFTDPPKEHPSE